MKFQNCFAKQFTSICHSNLNLPIAFVDWPHRRARVPGPGCSVRYPCVWPIRLARAGTEAAHSNVPNLTPSDFCKARQRTRGSGQKYATNKKYKRRNNIKFNLHFTTHTGRSSGSLCWLSTSSLSPKTAKCQRQFVYFRKGDAITLKMPSSTPHHPAGHTTILIDPLTVDMPEARRRPKCCLSSTLNFSSHCNCEMPWHFIFILFGQRSILSAISLAYFSPHFLRRPATGKENREKNLLKICIRPVRPPRRRTRCHNNSHLGESLRVWESSPSAAFCLFIFCRNSLARFLYDFSCN